MLCNTKWLCSITLNYCVNDHEMMLDKQYLAQVNDLKRLPLIIMEVKKTGSKAAECLQFI